MYGERGVIDILCFHSPTGSLLVIELKTEIVDVQDLVGGVDRKTRLAARVATERGWIARSTACWVNRPGYAHRSTPSGGSPVDAALRLPR